MCGVSNKIYRQIKMSASGTLLGYSEERQQIIGNQALDLK